MDLRSRPYASSDDLREMQSIISAAWRSEHRPRVPFTVGDLEWWVAGLGPDAPLADRLRLWTDGEEPVGWGWLSPPSTMDWFVRVGLPRSDEDRVRDEIVAWLAGVAAAAEPRPDTIATWAADGWNEAEFLVSRGFTPTDTTLLQFHRDLEGDLPEPPLPPGYSLRAIGADDIPARVEVHRAAFAPSRMTVEKYAILAGLDHYAFERDLVAVAPDGSFAAFTNCWLDASAAIGEFEPVGTHPDHRRLGLGKAANAFGLRRLRELGARDVIVFSEPTNPASGALYASVGFEVIATHRKYERANR
jgi:ribosomal protein S18 acetylase RimI-like enzyme